MVTLAIPDFRRPGSQQFQLGLRVPVAAVQRLDTQATRIGSTRAALARALLMRGLAELEKSQG